MPRMTELDIPTTGPFMFLLALCTIYTVWSKYQTFKKSIISHLYITLFIIYKPGALSLKNAMNTNAANALTLNLAWYR